jgi:TDG/mug DNA glycosylase family protein
VDVTGDATEPGGVDDLVSPGLRVLFCGINPGQTSGRLAQHFARPGNRFWKLLDAEGFTPGLVAPSEQERLLGYGIGITNVVERVTAGAADLVPAELRAGALVLGDKVARFRPAFVAVLGLGAYRVAFSRPRAQVGRQPELLGGAHLWLLPNPSGLQARYQLAEMTEQYIALRLEADRVLGPVRQLGH